MSDCIKIGKALRSMFRTNDYKLHNTFIYNWESDFFCVSASGYAIEVEIKISKSDFKADFKKEMKHLNLVGDNPSALKPNKFYYACPDGLISLVEIPAYAGLIYWNGSSCRKVKEAPFIHKAKQDLKSRLLSKYYNKSISIFNKLLEFRSNFTYGLPDNKKDELNHFISKFHEI